MIIVIDGPAGSGKSTTARAVAEKLNIRYLDSGALYRAATLLWIEAGEDIERFFVILDRNPIDFTHDDGFRVSVGGRDVTGEIRDPQVAKRVSRVAAMSRVRARINRVMRSKVSDGIYIAEGRDLGTAVFPDAELKFYMLADVEERARRRYGDLKEQNPGLSLESVREAILQRDKKDAGRASDPLRKAEDAIEIDTTDSNFSEQVEQICREIHNILE